MIRSVADLITEARRRRVGLVRMHILLGRVTALFERPGERPERLEVELESRSVLFELTGSPDEQIRFPWTGQVSQSGEWTGVSIELEGRYLKDGVKILLHVDRPDLVDPVIAKFRDQRPVG